MRHVYGIFLTCYFSVAALWVVFLCTTVIGSLARAGGNHYFWVFVGVAMAGYLLLQVMLWYVGAMWIVRRFKKGRIIFLIFFLTFFIFWMERCSLILFGRWEGVPLFQPIMLLLDSCAIRLLLRSIGTFYVLLFLHSMLLILCTSWRRIYIGWLLLVGISLLIGYELFIYKIAMEQTAMESAMPPIWFVRCAVIRPPFLPGVRPDPLVQVQAVAAAVAQIAERRSGCDLVFMPESALPFPLNMSPASHAALCSLSVGRTFCFGTHWLVDEECFNAAVCMVDGDGCVCHAKTHGMLGLERLPACLQLRFLMCGLAPLLGTGFFAQANGRQGWSRSICDMGGVTIAPLICSEFFYSYRIVMPTDTVVVALVNDAWFAGTPVSYLLRCCARLKSIVWQRPVLYISYCYAGLFDATGRWFAMRG